MKEPPIENKSVSRASQEEVAGEARLKNLYLHHAERKWIGTIPFSKSEISNGAHVSIKFGDHLKNPKWILSETKNNWKAVRLTYWKWSDKT